MVKLNALDLLNEKGKSRYWLNQYLGMSDQNLKAMLENRTKSISYKNIEQLCFALDCTPNELLVFEDGTEPADGSRR